MAQAFFTRELYREMTEKHGFEFGEFTYGAPAIHWLGEKARLKIGRYCSIASGVHIYLGGNHRTDWVTTYPFPAPPINQLFPGAETISGHPATKGDVIIGNDVWLANHAVILSGVTIGDGAAIGANTIVTRDVDPYTIVAGNPARFIRKRFSETQREALLEIRWWDWDMERVRQFVPLLCSGRIDEFIALARQP